MKESEWRSIITWNPGAKLMENCLQKLVDTNQITPDEKLEYINSTHKQDYIQSVVDNFVRLVSNTNYKCPKHFELYTFFKCDNKDCYKCWEEVMIPKEL